MNKETDDAELRVQQAREAAQQAKAQADSEPAAESADAAKVEALRTALEEAKQLTKLAQDDKLRALAEADNARRRAKLDVEKAHKFGLEKFAKEIINVLDSLERGLEVEVDADNEALLSMRQGMELTYKLMLDTLQKFNIQRLDPTGESFNPQQHEALSMVESPDHAPNAIMNVVQPGFMLNDRVIRPAKVIVAKSSTAQGQASSSVDEKA